MDFFRDRDGKPILLNMVKGIQDNKEYLSEVDGLIGDGDHGVNMNKGFSIFETRYGAEECSFIEGVEKLGTVLMDEIGGSMGPIYGTLFLEMAEAAAGHARVGDKTLIDTLAPAADTLKKAADKKNSLKDTLKAMVQAAQRGCDSTRELKAKYGRSSRLGERSKGVLDAGAVSCRIILSSMAEGILRLCME